MNENERHAVAHARYQVDHASPDNPDVCFDYQLVQTLLSLIAAPPASPLRGREDAAALVNRFERESMALHQTQREWLVREIGKAIASPPEQPAAVRKEPDDGR